MREILLNLKKNNHPGDKGRQNASDTNQLTMEIINVAQLWNPTLDSTTGDDLDGANLGDVYQMARSVDMATKQVLYFDYGTANQLHLKRRRDFTPITDRTQEIKYEQFVDGMCVFFIPKNDNTGACTLRLNELASKELVLPSGDPVNVGSIITDRAALAKYDATLDKFVLYSFSGQAGGAEALQMEFGSIDSIYYDVGSSPAKHKDIIHFKTNEEQFAKRVSLEDGAFFSFHFHKSVKHDDDHNKTKATRAFLYAKFDDIDVEFPIYLFGGDFDHDIQYDYPALHAKTALAEGMVYFIEYYKDANFFALHLNSAGDHTIIAQENALYYTPYKDPTLHLIPGLSSYVFKQYPTIVFFQSNDNFQTGHYTSKVRTDVVKLTPAFMKEIAVMESPSYGVGSINAKRNYLLTNRTKRRDITTHFTGTNYHFDYKFNFKVPELYRKAPLTTESGTLYSFFEKKENSILGSTNPFKEYIYLDDTERKAWSDDLFNTVSKLPIYLTLTHNQYNYVRHIFCLFIPYSKKLDTANIESLTVKQPSWHDDQDETSYTAYLSSKKFVPFYNKGFPLFPLSYYRNSSNIFLKNLFPANFTIPRTNSYFAFSNDGTYIDDPDINSLLSYYHLGYGFILMMMKYSYGTGSVKLYPYSRNEQKVLDGDTADYHMQTLRYQFLKMNNPNEYDWSTTQILNTTFFGNTRHEAVFDYEIKYRD